MASSNKTAIVGRQPEHQIGECQVGEHLPVSKQQRKPLEIWLADRSLLPNLLAKDCH
jgi:hypothetical protein